MALRSSGWRQKEASLRVPVHNAVIHTKFSGQGEPLVLVHGLSGSTRVWAHNMGHLSQFFTVYRLDLVGFGNSQGLFHLHRAAELLERWMDRMQIERAHVIGHSMGGYISLDLAARYPSRVNKLVLVDAVSAPLNRTWAGHAYSLLRAARYAPLAFLPVVLQDAYRAGPRTLLEATMQVVEADLSKQLKQVRTPTLLVWGQHDPLVPLSIGLRLYENLPKAQLKIIAKAGHNPMIEQPHTFNQLVCDFLNPA
jgi:pimeloyl-ACP methyl ester carboxylesterase